MTPDGLHVQDPDVRDLYRETHRGCELIRYFPIEDQWRRYVQIRGVRHSVPVSGYGQHIHHIFATGHERWDRVWNLLHISQTVHRWCHEYPKSGRVLALYHKLQVGEWAEANAALCLGRSMLGWAESYTPEAEEVEWVMDYWHVVRLEAA